MREESDARKESGGGRRVRVVTARPAAEEENAESYADDAAAGDFASAFARAMTLHKCQGEQRRPGDCEVAVLQSVYLRVVEHLSADTSREHGGLLLGYELRAQGRPPTVVVTHSLPAMYTKGTPTSLTFENETWEDIERKTDELGDQRLQRVGWYHSHPNISIFLSGHDIDVCSNFTRPTHIALVVDPVKDNGGFFVRGVGSEGFRQYSPQGFIELHDRRERSVVTWQNMTSSALSVPAGGLEGVLSPVERGGAPPEENLGLRPIHVKRPRKPGYIVPKWAVYASAAAGVCLLGGLALASVMASQALKQVAILERARAEKIETTRNADTSAEDASATPTPTATTAPTPEAEPAFAPTPPAEVAGAGGGAHVDDGGAGARRGSHQRDDGATGGRSGGGAGTPAGGQQPAAPRHDNNAAAPAPAESKTGAANNAANAPNNAGGAATTPPKANEVPKTNEAPKTNEPKQGGSGNTQNRPGGAKATPTPPQKPKQGKKGGAETNSTSPPITKGNLFEKKPEGK